MDDCLALRQQLKQEFRARLRKATGGIISASAATIAAAKQKALTTTEKYGGFFGPSEVIFSDRVIEEIQTCLRIPKSVPSQEVGRQSNKSVVAGSSKKKVISTMLGRIKEREKAQWLKNTRDYSFLSSDCEIPGNNEPEISKPVDMKGSKIQGVNKAGIKKACLNSRPVDTKGLKIQGVNKVAIKKVSPNSRPVITKGSKIQGVLNEAAIKNVSQNSRPLVQMMKNEINGSKVEGVKAIKRVSQNSRPETTEQVISRDSSKKPTTKKNPCLKRKLEEAEETNAVSLIRKMFRYDPTKFCDEEDDVNNMEATFDDIQKEERRSTKIAKKEDDEELKKILGIKIIKNVKQMTD
ncbi:hypothetical protein ACP275_08G221800 [Erythranthe tilingii]